MPIYQQTVAGGGAQFDGAAAATGLLAPGATGGAAIQVRINSITFETGGAITDWTLRIQDSSTATFNPVLLTDTTTEFVCGGPAGFMLLPTTAAGVSWNVQFITTGMAAAGTITIDYDFSDTES